jgi:hypothetical protein
MGERNSRLAGADCQEVHQSAEWNWESVHNHWSGIIDWVPLGRNESERQRTASSPRRRFLRGTSLDYDRLGSQTKKKVSAPVRSWQRAGNYKRVWSAQMLEQELGRRLKI